MLNEEVARETINAVAGPAKQVAYYFVRKAVQLNEKELAKFIQQMKTASADTLKEMSSRLELFRIMRMECLDTAKTLASRKGEC